MPNAEYVGPIGVFVHDFKNAEKLQAAARGYQGRCEVKRMHKSCLVIIAALRGKRARRAYRKKVRAAEIIQKSVRRKQAALEESRSRVKELFRVEAARTIKRFIDAVDDEDLEALGKVVTTTSTLIVELQGAGVTVSNTYKGVRSFISKKQEASKKGLRHVSLDVMPLRLVAESFTFPRSGTKPALVAEATYVRDVQGGRLQARLEYVVRTANTEDREKGRKAWVLLSMGIPPQCYVVTHRIMHQRADSFLGLTAPNPDVTCETTAKMVGSAPPPPPPQQQQEAEPQPQPQLQLQQRSVSLPVLSVPAKIMVYSHGAADQVKRQAARGSIFSDPVRIEAAVLDLTRWSDERSPAGTRLQRPGSRSRSTSRLLAQASSSGQQGSSLEPWPPECTRSRSRDIRVLPPLPRLPDLPLWLQPPESRAIARDRRALSRHLSRQSVGRSGISWSHHSAVFRLKYNGNLRTGTGIRLAPTVKLKVPLCGHPGQATASALPLMSTLPSKFEAEPGEEAALSNTII